VCCITQHESLVSPIDRRSDYYRQAAFLAAKDQPKRVRQPLLTIPNVLTFARLIMVPVLVGLWYSPQEGAKLAAAYVFLGASITDWLDGYLARRVRALLICCAPQLLCKHGFLTHVALRS
jgi:CDP-diacylglycerol---glycerol-3-phosphate 3-phosphatidyltransferase